MARALGPLLAAVALLGGCSTTRAWERGTLARPEMDLDACADEEATRHHVQAQREAATSPGGGAGGGCGCN